MFESSVCYVTSFYDIGRADWNNRFTRTFETYMKDFEAYLNLFDKGKCGDNILIIYMHDKHMQTFENFVKIKSPPDGCSITIIPTNEEFLNTMHAWKTLPLEEEIMNDPVFKARLFTRSGCPEHKYPKYTLINHIKIDLVCHLLKNKTLDVYSTFSWVDFGFFANKKNISYTLLDLKYFNTSKINYCLLNPLTEYDRDIQYNLQIGPERFGGFFFLGGRDALTEYQEVYHNMHEYFQKTLRIADDDQHVALQCYFFRPSLFELRVIPDWHQTFILFSDDV